jgi:hypothetical protein
MGHVLRKSPLQKALLARFGTVIILCAGCLSFVILHRVFGGARQPSGELDIFPRKIWQSWKVDSLRFEARDAERAMTWTLKNPAYRYEVLTDANAETYGAALSTLLLRCIYADVFQSSSISDLVGSIGQTSSRYTKGCQQESSRQICCAT